MALVAGTAAATTTATMPIALRALRRWQVLDVPNERSSHRDVIPRGGGLAVLSGLAAGTAAAAVVGLGDRAVLAVVAATSLAFGVLGFLDDVASRSARVRLAAQAVIGAAGAMAVLALSPEPPWWNLLLAPFVLAWVVGFVNAFNFMDGVNGISGAHALVFGAALAALGAGSSDTTVVVGALAAASAAAFLPWNAPRARIFLGDAGSYGIGGWLALGALVAVTETDWPVAALAPAAIYVADTSTTLVRRARRGDPVFDAHREHTYQRLNELGWGHLGATGITASASTCCALLGLAGEYAAAGGRAATLAGMLLVTGLYVTSPRLLGARHGPIDGATTT